MGFPWFSRIFTRTPAQNPLRSRKLVLEVLEDRALLSSGPDLVVPHVQNNLVVSQVLTAPSVTSARPVQQAVFNPTTRQWFLYPSASSFATFPAVPVTGGLPVAADYAGTGKAQLGVYAVVGGVGTWYIQGQPTPIQFGLPGDIPVPADYAGIGSAQIAVYRPSTGQWFIRNQATQKYVGLPGDIPAPAKYFGTQAVQLAFYRPSNGNWYVQGAAGPQFFGFPGVTSILAVPGDYLSKGAAQFALYRTDNATWYIKGAVGPIKYGTAFVTRPAPGIYGSSGFGLGAPPPSMSVPTPFNVHETFKPTITVNGGIATLQIPSLIFVNLPPDLTSTQDSSKGITTISGTPQQIIQVWETFLESAEIFAKNRLGVGF